MRRVAVTGSFDDLRCRDVRLLEEASRLGDVHVLMWSDAAAASMQGKPPRFPEAERLYMLEALRFVGQITVIGKRGDSEAISDVGGLRPAAWVVDATNDSARKRTYCASLGIDYRVVDDEDLNRIPPCGPDDQEEPASRKRVMVTGCFDWFHSGHVRFFEEVSALGELYVVVGHDANIRLLKGEGHPLLLQEERRYMVQAVRHVKRALISSGHGWLDAEPEITGIKPDIYAVNEDGDVPEKRALCRAHGIEYVVLARQPKEGLPSRNSTCLRGF